MGKLVLILYISSWLLIASCMDVINETDPFGNSSDPNKDIYVIHAMVYQVGILTNKTDNDTENFNTTSHQEALTFYHNNGTQVDLSKIPEPLVTNVKAQSLVGVAPVSNTLGNPGNHLPWSTLNDLTNVAAPSNSGQDSEKLQSLKFVQDADINPNAMDRAERSLENLYQRLFKREASDGDTPVVISKGAAVIPQGAGVQSIAIPPLLTLNNNLSAIPVPIPNTSIVHYAKINTLVTKP